MTAPVVARTAGAAVRSGPVTAAERNALAQKVAAAQAAKGPPPAPAPRPNPSPSQPSPPRRPPAPPVPSRPPKTPRPNARPANRPAGRLWGNETITSSAAGVVLALLFWGWVALPLIQGGPAQVRNTLRAKFFNKDAEGKWLP